MSADVSITQRLQAPLQAVRDEHARGRRIIGYVGDDVPVELILAADALPLRLFGMTQSSTPLADQYLESSFGPAARSLLEAWLHGELDFLDAIVFPRSNDTAQRLYYYVCELQRRTIHAGPRALIYDVARIDRDTSRAHSLAATRKLAAELGTSLDRLEGAHQRLRDRASLFRELSNARAEQAAIAGSVALQAWRTLQLDWTSDFEARMRDWIDALPRRTYTRRLLVAGSSPPDERLHCATEAADCNVVDEFFDDAPAHSALRWTDSGASLEAIADAYRKARSTAVCLLQSPDILIERARQVAAQGVILWCTEEDEAIVWEVPRQLARLRAAGLAVLALTRQQWHADEACLAQITTFARNLEALAP